MKEKRFGAAPLRYLLGFFAAVAVWYIVYYIVAYIMAVLGKVPFLGAILYYPSDFAFAAVSIPIFCSVAAAAYCSNWICGTERPFCIAAIIVYGVTLIAAIVTRVITWRTFEGCALMIATSALFFFDSDPVREKKEKRKKSKHKSAISEVVANSIDTACVDNLDTYEQAIISLLTTDGLEGEELEQALNNEIKLYKDSVFDDTWEALPQDSGVDFRVRACFACPTIAGAQESVTTEYIDENGISADLAYLFFVYAITGISASELSPERAAERTAEAHKLHLRQSYLIEEAIQEARSAVPRHRKEKL